MNPNTMIGFLELLELSQWCWRLGTIEDGRRFAKDGRGEWKGVSQFVNGFEKKTMIFFKPFKMKLMQVWFANPMRVDEALSIQNRIGAIKKAWSLRPSTWFCFNVG